MSEPFEGILRVSGNVTVRMVGVEAFLMDMGSFRTYSLNETAAFIFIQIDGAHSVEDILNAVLDRYEISPEECRRAVRSLLDTLMSEHLVVPADQDA